MNEKCINIEEDLELIMAEAIDSDSISKSRSDLIRLIRAMEKNRSALHDYIKYEEMIEINNAIQVFKKLKNRFTTARDKLVEIESIGTSANKY